MVPSTRITVQYCCGSKGQCKADTPSGCITTATLSNCPDILHAAGTAHDAKALCGTMGKLMGMVTTRQTGTMGSQALNAFWHKGAVHRLNGSGC